MKVSLLAVVSAAHLAVGCADERQAQPPASSPDGAPTASVAEPPAQAPQDTAGGETTEFPEGPGPGANPVPCSQVASRAPRALSDADVVAWAAAVDGRHELALAWKPQFLGGKVTGFEFETTIVLDITTVGAAEIRWAGGCTDPRTLHLELEIDLRVTDGSLSGKLPHVVSVVPGADPAAGAQLGSPWAPSPPAVNFLDALQLGEGDLTGRRTELTFGLALVDGQLRGDLSIWVEGEHDQDHLGVGAGATVLRAVFPDDGCTLVATPLALDALLEDHGASGAALLASATQILEAQAWPAHWRRELRGPDLSSTTTRFSVAAGERICVEPTRAQVPIILTLATTDSKLDFELPATLSFMPGATTSRLGLDSVWIPSADFKAITDVEGADAGLRPADYGSIGLELTLDAGRNTLAGQMYVDRFRDWDPQAADHPQLVWTGQ
ncbi:MAG: hypothetical protein OXR73_10005 [Myxococcales bacterium]|nr:hypothetical protein [Myxococcales bacterium]